MLTPTERAEAELVFGASLDYTRVGVVENTPLPNWIADLGRSPKPNAITLGNVSYFPETLQNSAEAIASGNLRTMAWLIHELTHQWQFQHLGWGYLARAVWAQLREGQKSYRYRLEDGRHLMEFNMEQQGDIARDYYLALKRGENVSAWEPVVAEFRGR